MGNKLYVGNPGRRSRRRTERCFLRVRRGPVRQGHDGPRNRPLEGLRLRRDGPMPKPRAAINGLNGQAIGGRAVVVNEARPAKSVRAASAARTAVAVMAVAAAWRRQRRRLRRWWRRQRRRLPQPVRRRWPSKEAAAAVVAAATAAAVTDPRRRIGDPDWDRLRAADRQTSRTRGRFPPRGRPCHFSADRRAAVAATPAVSRSQSRAAPAHQHGQHAHRPGMTAWRRPRSITGSAWRANSEGSAERASDSGCRVSGRVDKAGQQRDDGRPRAARCAGSCSS